MASSVLKLPVDNWAEDWGFSYEGAPKAGPGRHRYKKVLPMRRIANPKINKHYDQCMIWLRTDRLVSNYGGIKQWARFAIYFMRQEFDPGNPGRLRERTADKKYKYLLIVNQVGTYDSYTKTLDGIMNALMSALSSNVRTVGGMRNRLGTIQPTYVHESSEFSEFDPDEVEAIAHFRTPFTREKIGSGGYNYWRQDPKHPNRKQQLALLLMNHAQKWVAHVRNVFPGAYALNGVEYQNPGHFEKFLTKRLTWKIPPPPEDRRFKFRVANYDPTTNSVVYYVYLNGRKPLLICYIRNSVGYGWALTGIHRKWFSDAAVVGDGLRRRYATHENLTEILDAIYAHTNDAAHQKVMQLGEDFDPDEVEDIASADYPAWKNLSRPNTIRVESSYGSITVDSQGNILDSNIEEIGGDDEWAATMRSATKFDIDEYEQWWQKRIASGVDILDIGFWFGEGEYCPAEADYRREHSAEVDESAPFGWFNQPDRSTDSHVIATRLVEDFDPEEVEATAQGAMDTYMVEVWEAMWQNNGEQWPFNSIGQLMTWQKSADGTLKWNPSGDSLFKAYEIGPDGLPSGKEYDWYQVKELADQGKDVHAKLLMQNEDYPGARWAMWWLPNHNWELEDIDNVWTLRLWKSA